MNRLMVNSRALNRGAILLLSLVFILMLALIAGMVIKTAILQLHMAGNDRFLEEAIHKAQAIVTELSLTPKNFSLEGGLGYTNCVADSQALYCDLRALKAPGSGAASQGVEVDYRVTRAQPLLWKSFPIRESQESASSSTSVGAANFEISVRIDGGESRLGKANVVQGIAVRVPVFR